MVVIVILYSFGCAEAQWRGDCPESDGYVYIVQHSFNKNFATAGAIPSYLYMYSIVGSLINKPHFAVISKNETTNSESMIAFHFHVNNCRKARDLADEEVEREGMQHYEIFPPGKVLDLVAAVEGAIQKIIVKRRVALTT